MDLVSPLDAVFLIGETRRRPMHVAALQLFDMPDHAGPDYMEKLHKMLIADADIDPTFRKHAVSRFRVPRPAWIVDKKLEIERHVQRWVMPEEADSLQDMLDLVSQLHSQRLDPRRPLWESHLINCPAIRRFGIYTKMHHSLTDGVAGLHALHRSLKTDPSAAAPRGPWHLPSEHPQAGTGTNSLAVPKPSPTAIARTPWRRIASLMLRDPRMTRPFTAPKTMLNRPTLGKRRIVVASYSLERLRVISRATQSTINDIVLALTASALRSYLRENHCLPEKSLIGLVPVSLRTESEKHSSGGNKLGAILCPLATDISDPLERLGLIRTTMQQNKALYRELSRAQAIVLTAVLLSPLLLPLLRDLVARTFPPFNIVISNMHGAQQQLYLGDARLVSCYPLSVPADGQTLNITAIMGPETIDIGIVAYDQSVPQLPNIVQHLTTALAETEAATLDLSPVDGFGSGA
ncbi:wax ester/triacylglycerol synthase family O-acyltransferase [Nocardia goodfellowii]